MTTVEKIVLGLIIVVCVALTASVYTTVSLIEDMGIKEIVNQLWCGNNGCVK
jgi:hypothetical protein